MISEDTVATFGGKRLSQGFIDLKNQFQIDIWVWAVKRARPREKIPDKDISWPFGQGCSHLEYGTDEAWIYCKMYFECIPPDLGGNVCYVVQDYGDGLYNVYIVYIV